MNPQVRFSEELDSPKNKNEKKTKLQMEILNTKETKN